MKILLLNWQDRQNPQAGGAEIHLHEIFGRLARRGHEVSLLASGWKGAAPAASLDGMDVHRTGSRHTYGLAAPPYYRARLRDAEHDLVVEALNKVPVYSPLWSRSPVVLLVHHLFGATAFREASFPIASLTWLLERPLAAVYRRSAVQAISESTADDLARRGLDRGAVEVIHPGVDLDFFTPPDRPHRAAEPTFLYLGRLKRYKGVDQILHALSHLRRGGISARLLVGGKGEWEPALRRLTAELRLEEQVDFLGYVSEERKRELFRSAWANVFPSPKEGWGITNIEAGACGTPSIASDSPGLRESVRHEVTGLLVPHGDSEALAGAMRRLALHPAEVQRLGAGALDFARSLGWDEATRATERHLAEQLERSRRT